MTITTTTPKPKQNPYEPDRIEEMVWELADVLEEARETNGPAATERAANAARLVARQMLALERSEPLAQAAPITAHDQMVSAVRDQKINLAYNLARRAYGVIGELTELQQQLETLRSQMREQLQMIKDLRELISNLPSPELVDVLMERVITSGEPIDTTGLRQLSSQIRQIGQRLDALEKPKKQAEEPKKQYKNRRGRYERKLALQEAALSQ